MSGDTRDNFVRNYVCDCDHSDIMHSEHDGCTLCDCEINRAEVIKIGKLFRERNALWRELEALKIELRETNHGFEIQRQAFVDKAKEYNILKSELEALKKELNKII